MTNGQMIIPERRLHPMTLAYQALRNLPAFLLPVYFAVFQGNTEEWVYILLSIIILFFTVPNILLQYYFFTFYLTDKEIVVKSGVFSRKQRNVSLSRVQNVNIEHNVIQQIFGLTKVEIETAGDTQTEAKLEYVSKQDAHELRETIRKYQSTLDQATPMQTAAAQSISERFLMSEADDFREMISGISAKIAEPIDAREGKRDKQLFSMSILDAAKLGVLRFRPVILVIVMWLFGVLTQFRIIDLESQATYSSVQSFVMETAYFGWPIFILGSIIFLLLTTWLLDSILTINQYYNFTLATDGTKLYTNYGLLTKRHATVPLKKLQSITITTNAIKKYFDFYKMDIQTAGLGSKSGNAESVIPFAKESALIDLAKNIRDFIIPEQFNSVSKKTIRRTFVRYMISLSILSIILYVTFDFGFWLFLGSPLLLYFSYLRWKFMGWAIIGNNIIVKKGVWLQRKTVIPIEKIQTLHVTRTFFQRRLGLSTMSIDTAASAFMSDTSIVDIIDEESIAISEQLSRKFHELVRRHEVSLNTA